MFRRSKRPYGTSSRHQKLQRHQKLRSSAGPHGIKSCVRSLVRARGGGEGDEADIEAGSDEDVPGSADPIVRALGRARGGGEGDEAEIEAGSDEDVPGGADPIV